MVAIGGLLPLGARLWWGLELLSHFRLQYLAVAAAGFVLAILLRRPLIAGALVVVALINAWPVLPYLRHIPPAAAGEPLVVLNLNVNAGNADHAAILERIRQSAADIVTIVELSETLDRELEALAERYPYSATYPSADPFGIGVLSRYPLTASVPFELGPTVGIATRIAIGERRLSLFAVHPLPPMSAAMAATRNAQLQTLAARARLVEGPLVVCGDFNLTPYSPYFADFVGASGLRDAGRGRGVHTTWPTELPLLGIPIDHCFVRGPLATETIERMEPDGSDHYPLRVGFRWQDDP